MQYSWDTIQRLAADREKWREYVGALQDATGAQSGDFLADSRPRRCLVGYTIVGK